MKRIVLISVLFSFVFLSHAQIWKVPEGHETRWTSFENPTGAKGTAAQAGKSSVSCPLKPSDSAPLC